MVIALDRDVPGRRRRPRPARRRRLPSCVRPTASSRPLAGVIAGVALAIAAADGPSARIVRPILVVLWAAAGLLLGCVAG